MLPNSQRSGAVNHPIQVNENTVQVPVTMIPCYQKIVDLINDKTILVTREESPHFRQTCAFFNLQELQHHTEIYFMTGTFSISRFHLNI